MTIQDTVERAQQQQAGGVLHPLVLVRMAEHQHRKASGPQPECIKLSPDFYHEFMEAYRIFRNMGDDDVKAQIDMEHPHILGIPIVCNPGARAEIEIYVPPGRKNLIIVPS
jgi:hypothetical protein